MSKNIDLNDILAFVAVGKYGSFTKAAQSLGVPKSYVSRKILELEQRLKTQLIERTTRKVSLTAEGESYFAVCEKSLKEIALTEKSFELGHQIPSGNLRVTCPVEFGPILMRQVGKFFLKKHPQIQLEVVSTNTVLDFIKDRIDIAIRPIQLADPSLKSIQLGEFEWKLYASPQWKHINSQNLESFETLSNLDFIGFNPSLQSNKKWKIKLTNGASTKEFNFQPKVVSANLSVLIEALVEGIGTAPVPDILVEDLVKSKKLVPIFENWYCRKEKIAAVFLDQKNIPPRVRVFLDFLKTHQLFQKYQNS